MLTKQDTKMAQGLAIIGMLMLHLFCRGGDLPYEVSLYAGDTPLIYYIGLFGDLCVPVYCFCSGYAQYLLTEKDHGRYTAGRLQRIRKFLVHFWIIVFAFACVGLLADKGNVIPGSLSKFVGNVFLFGLSYNGAWWFVITYIFLVLLTPAIYRIMNRSNPWLFVFLSGVAYFIAYVFRFAYVVDFQNAVLAWLWTQVILLGTSQFPFVIGMCFCKYNIIGVLQRYLDGKRFRSLLLVGIPILMFLIHCVERSLIIAPITGLTTLTCFHLWKKPDWVKSVFAFLGRHSMNIWLTHMFFYLTLFPGLVFAARYPVLIVCYLAGICILISYGIDWVEKGIYSIFRYFKLCKS